MPADIETERQKNARLVVLFFIGVILFNYPILSLFSDKEKEIFGVPLLYIFIFVTWAALIFLTAWTTCRQDRKGSFPE